MNFQNNLNLQTYIEEFFVVFSTHYFIRVLTVLRKTEMKSL